jgi:transcriptional regulator with XRE-family HTH domain
MTAKRVAPRLDFSRAIETLREARGLSREQAAQLARISPSYLSEIERGLKRPSADIIARVARAFGMKTSSVMEFIEELSAPQPDDEAPPRPIQLALKRGRALPLFSAEDAPATAPPGSRRRRGVASAGDRSGDLIATELVVIARRLNPQDRRALLQLARHLLSR